MNTISIEIQNGFNIQTGFNPARYPALQHAQNRANREKQPCAVYFGVQEKCKQVFTPSGYNVWYVRPATDPAPEGAHLYATVEPEGGAK